MNWSCSNPLAQIPITKPNRLKLTAVSSKKATTGAIVHDAPVAFPAGETHWGSDPVAAVLRAVDVPYIALVPGSSYRGLHDSIVNYLGNRAPQMILTLHEENTVAIAHGYAKASGRMMAAAVRSSMPSTSTIGPCPKIAAR